jgi:hypothetical protein
VFVVESNPTVEHIAKILFDYTVFAGIPGGPGDGVGNAHVIRDIQR